MLDCVYVPARKLHGYSEEVWNRLRSYVGDSIPTQGKFANIVRNLGLDDVRMVNIKNEKGKRFFGKNIADVKDLDLTKSVPNNTLVRVPTANGEQFFISNKNNVTTVPTRWELDTVTGRPVPNADWDPINVNVTGMRQYTRDDEGVWRLVTDDDKGGAFLNIQNPTRENKTFSEIIEEGFDAIEVDGGYRLVHEESQAINPHTITQRRSRGRLLEETDTATPDDMTINQQLIHYGVPQKIAGGIAGSIAGNLADEYNEYSGAFWGGALGVALGTRNVRTYTKGAFNKVTGRGPKREAFDDSIYGVTVAEREHTMLKTAWDKGYRGDPSDVQEARLFLKNLHDMEQMKLDGDFNWWNNGLFKNDIFESGTGLLTSLGTIGKQLNDVLIRFQDKPYEMYSQLANIQARYFKGGKQEFKQAQLDFIRSVPAFRQLSDEEALQSFGAAVYRLRTFGGKMEEGKFVYDTNNAAARRAYESDIFMDTDIRLLRDENAQKAYRTISDFYDARYEEFTEAIKAKLKIDIDELKLIDHDIYKLVEDVLKNNITIKQYMKSLDLETQGRTYKKLNDFLNGDYGGSNFQAQNKALAERIDNLIDDNARFVALKGKYIPQLYSKVRDSLEMKKWMDRNPDLKAHTESRLRELWETEKVERILRNNDDKWHRLDQTADQMDINAKVYSTASGAEEDLQRFLNHMPHADRKVVTDFIADQGNMWQDAFLRRQGDTYYLTTPTELRGYFTNGLFHSENLRVATSSNKMFTTANLTKTANLFDRPRKMNLPTEFLEMDMERLSRMYSEDMSIRLHAIKNNLYDDNDFNRYWRTRFKRELGERVDPERFKRDMGRVESWIKMMQGQRSTRKIATNPEDARRLMEETRLNARNDIFFNSLAKIVTTPFNYMTTLYSMFTPAVLGPFVTSWRGIANQYKRGFLSPREYAREMKEMTKNMYEAGIIERKFESYRTQYRHHHHEDILGMQTSGLKTFASLADKATNFSAEFSLTRMVGIDPENLGIARLAVGGMLDVSGYEAAKIGRAGLHHIQDLITAYKGLDESGMTRIGRTRHSKETLAKEFYDMGISDMDGFIRRSEDFAQTIDGQEITGVGVFEKRMIGKAVEPMDDQFFGEMNSIMNNIVDSYHARGKTTRPLKWLDNVWGRALSRYSVYAQNFGVQTTGNRIYRPLRDWNEKAGRMSDESVPMSKLMYYRATKNQGKFKELFGDNWESAYNDFPMEAVNNTLKVFGALGMGQAMMLTRAGILDLTGIAANEALGNEDYEMWRNINRRMEMGRYADTGEPFTLGDIFAGDVQGFDLFKVFAWRLGMESAVSLGFAGRAGQVVTQDMRFAGGGVADITPVSGAINDIYQRTARIMHEPTISGRLSMMPRELLEVALLRATPVGTLYDARQAVMSKYLEDQVREAFPTVQDPQTGIRYNIHAHGPDFF